MSFVYLGPYCYSVLFIITFYSPLWKIGFIAASFITNCLSIVAPKASIIMCHFAIQDFCSYFPNLWLLITTVINIAQYCFISVIFNVEFTVSYLVDLIGPISSFLITSCIAIYYMRYLLYCYWLTLNYSIGFLNQHSFLCLCILYLC